MMEIIVPLLGIVVPVVALTWTLLDLTHVPSKAKALLKIVLGAAQSATMLQYGNDSAVAIIFACAGLLIMLLGLADMVACRTKDIK